MKHIITLLLFICAFAFTSQAQYIHRDNTNFITDTGVQLTDSELISIIGQDTFYETVVGARKQYEAGGNLIFGGSLAFMSGIICYAVGAYDSDFGYFLTGTFLLGGAATLDAGIVLRIIGKSRLNWVESYANKNYSSINLGVTPNGFGISMTF